MASENRENVNGLRLALGNCFKSFKRKTLNVGKSAKELGEEDPRRIVHSFKVAFAITLVSLIYHFDFFFDGFGVSAMWAVMTVVVVFEFSVGATLGKGINRVIATFIGGLSAVGSHRLITLTGDDKAETCLQGLSVFLISAIATFIRFFPKLKARYDYGVMIFILTFSLISVSGYRDDEVLEMAHKRITTIVIGSCAAVLICIFICPIWAGADLHKLSATNIEKLGIFLEDKCFYSNWGRLSPPAPLFVYLLIEMRFLGFGRGYFETSNDKTQDNEASLDGYKNVLNSKANEESLVNFAKWEPRHGRFRYRHPWDQYLKIGSDTRECACKIHVLNGYLLKSEMHTKEETERNIWEPCTKMSMECSLALREIALGMKTMTRPSSANAHISNAKSASKDLKSSLQTDLWRDIYLVDVINPDAVVASLLIEIVSCTARIAESVHELASMSNFRNQVVARQEVVAATPCIQGSQVVNVAVE